MSFKNMDSPAFLLAVISLFIVVCLRSYVGMLLDFPWKAEKSWGLILICAIVLGKACGGILADAIGSFKASFLSLGISAILFVFSQYPVAGILAVFLFNMTMPITLWAVARILPGAKGFLWSFNLWIVFRIYTRLSWIKSDNTYILRFCYGILNIPGPFTFRP